jgi:MFS family permease
MMLSSATHISLGEPVKKDILPGAWLVVALLSFVGTLNYLDRTTITTMRDSIMTSIPMNNAQFGLLTSVFLWIYGFSSPFVGFLADRFSKSKVVIISLIVWSLATMLTGFSKTFDELLATRILMGISEASYIPASLALIMDYHKGSTRSLATGINMVGLMVGSSLGFLGGWIAEKHTWNLAFHIFGVIGIVYSLLLIFVLRDAPKNTLTPEEKQVKKKMRFFDALKSLLSRRSYILMIIFWALLGIVGWLIVGWLPSYFQDHFNLSQSLAGLYATGFIYPSGIVGLLLGGFVADRWNKLNPRGRILTPVIGLCVAAPSIFIASYTSILPLAIAFFIVYFLSRTFTDANLMPILSMVADANHRATGYGILNLFATIVGGIGIYAGGALKDSDIGFNLIFQSASILLLICAALLYLVRPDIKRT